MYPPTLPAALIAVPWSAHTPHLLKMFRTHMFVGPVELGVQRAHSPAPVPFTTATRRRCWGLTAHLKFRCPTICVHGFLHCGGDP